MIALLSSIIYQPRVSAAQSSGTFASLAALCSKAIVADPRYGVRWDGGRSVAVAEAKSRGLDPRQCEKIALGKGRGDGSSVPTAHGRNSKTIEAPRELVALCSRAIANGRWETAHRHLDAVRSAKSRGLTAGQCEQLAIGSHGSGGW